MEKININIRTLAKIVKGTKRKKRKTKDLEVAEEINNLYNKYKSLNNVGRILRLSPEMVRQIKSLCFLEDEVKQLYRDGVLKGYDVGYRMTKLKRIDQIIMARYIVNNVLNSKDVRAIVKYKIDNPKIPIVKVISKVIQSKNKKIYVFFLGIDKELFAKLSDKIKENNMRGVILSIFNSFINYKFINYFEMNGRVVILKVLKEGLIEMRKKSKELKVPLSKLAVALVKDYLGDNR